MAEMGTATIEVFADTTRARESIHALRDDLLEVEAVVDRITAKLAKLAIPKTSGLGPNT